MLYPYYKEGFTLNKTSLKQCIPYVYIIYIYRLCKFINYKNHLFYDIKLIIYKIVCNSYRHRLYHIVYDSIL